MSDGRHPAGPAGTSSGSGRRAGPSVPPPGTPSRRSSARRGPSRTPCTGPPPGAPARVLLPGARDGLRPAARARHGADRRPGLLHPALRARALRAAAPLPGRRHGPGRGVLHRAAHARPRHARTAAEVPYSPGAPARDRTRRPPMTGREPLSAPERTPDRATAPRRGCDCRAAVLPAHPGRARADRDGPRCAVVGAGSRASPPPPCSRSAESASPCTSGRRRSAAGSPDGPWSWRTAPPRR